MKNIFSSLSLLLSVGCASILGLNFYNSNFKKVETPTIARVDNRLAIIKEIKMLSQVVTSETTVENQIELSKATMIPYFNINAGETKLTYVGSTNITVGLDLSDPKSFEVVETPEDITITIDSPDIISNNVDVTTSEVSQYSKEWFSNVDPVQLQSEAERKTLVEAKKIFCATEWKLVNQQRIISNLNTLLKPVTKKPLYIEVRESTKSTCS